MDSYENWSSLEVMSTLALSYTTTKSEATTWQHDWGLEIGAEASFKANLWVSETEFKLNTTVTYSGSYTKENTVTKEEKYERSKQFPCPPFSRCLFKLIASKLVVPFVATVERSSEVH